MPVRIKYISNMDNFYLYMYQTFSNEERSFWTYYSLLDSDKSKGRQPIEAPRFVFLILNRFQSSVGVYTWVYRFHGLYLVSRRWCTCIAANIADTSTSETLYHGKWVKFVDYSWTDIVLLSDVVCNGTSPIPWCKVGAGSLVATRRSIKLRA